MIEIKRNNTVLVELEDWTEGAMRSRQLMDHDYIKVPFTLANPVYLKLGDYIETDYGKFEITDKSTVEPTHNEDTGGYDYTVQFDAEYVKWKNKKLKYIPEDNVSELSFDLTASINVHLGVLKRNLDKLCRTDSSYRFGGTDLWTTFIGDDVTDASKLISYRDNSIYDTLTTIAETFECEWWVVDNCIYFGRCEKAGDVINFKIDDNVETMTASDSDKDFATRLYVFGSTRNIPANYRPSEAGISLNGVVQRRLMMPVGVPYLQSANVSSEQEAVEAVVIFDEVYPRVQCEVGAVTTYEKTVENEDNTTTTKTFYRVSDTSGFINRFDKSMILEGETLRIKFESGSLNGMEFDCALIQNDEVLGKCFEVVVNEDYGRELPDADLHPRAEDKYVIYNWDSTKISSLNIIPEAELELKNEGQKYLDHLHIDPSNYTCGMVSDYIYNDGEVRYFELGQRVKLINTGFFVSGRTSRIIGFEFHLDIPWDAPQYIVGENASSSRLSKLEGEIQAIVVGGNTYYSHGTGTGGGVYVVGTHDNTPLTDSNTLSSLRSIYSFLRKNVEDTATAILHFLRGITIGRFVTGWKNEGGQGARIDEFGNIECESLRSRGFIETEELRFNRIDVVSGELWNSIAFGLIEEVDTERQVVTLKLEEGELSGIHKDDICRGLFHNLTGNAEETLTEDSAGFLQLAGFSSSYFTPTLIYDNGKSFKYALREGTSVHPSVGMKFAVYGSFTDKSRQASAYSNRFYKRYLSGVDTWVINPSKHIVMQSGKLDGLTIGSVTMSGYGTYLNNVYMTGANVQFDKDTLDELKGKDAYSVVLSQYDGVLLIDDEGNIIDSEMKQLNVTARENSNVVARDGGSTANVVVERYALSSTIQVHKGAEPLIYGTDVEEGHFIVALASVGCTAVVQNGVMYITAVDSSVENPYVDITVNCEGNATFTVRYSITLQKQAFDAITVDMSNEMETFACDSKGHVLAFSNVGSDISMWNGDDRMYITKAVIESLPSGINVTAIQYIIGAGQSELELPIGEAPDGARSAGLFITGFSDSAAATNKIVVAVTGKMSATSTQTYTKKCFFSLNKMYMGENAVNYSLLPNHSEIVVKKDGSIVGFPLQCYVVEKNGTSAVVTHEQELPDGLSMTTYLIQSGIESSEMDYPVGQIILRDQWFPLKDGNGNMISTLIINPEYAVKIVFKLFYMFNGTKVLIDKEGIPFLQDGNDGDDAYNPVSIYTNSVDKPTKPTGYSPSGWSRNPVSVNRLKISRSGNFLDDGGWFKSPPIGHSQDVFDRLNIEAEENDQSFVVEMKASSEDSYDIGYVGNLDDEDVFYDNLGMVSGTDIQRIDVNVVMRGTHFLNIAYEKDSNVSEGEDCVRYRILRKRLWCSDSLAFDEEGNVTEWSDPYVIESEDSISGPTQMRYFIESDVDVINFSHAGFPTPSSFALRAKMQVGSNTPMECMTLWWKVWAYDGTNWIDATSLLASYSNTQTKRVALQPSQSLLYKQYSVRCYTSNPSTATRDTEFAAEKVIGVSVNGQPGGKGDDAKYIYVRGTSWENHQSTDGQGNSKTQYYSRIKICGNVTNNANRGLIVWYVNRETLEISNTTVCDTYQWQQGQMINYACAPSFVVGLIEDLPENCFIVVASSDCVYWTEEMCQAFQSVGAREFSLVGAKRTPFAFIGYKGLSKGAGYLQITEYAGNGDYDAVPAEIGVYVAEGAFATNQDGIEGKDGEDGAFPRDRGFFQEGTEYYYRMESDGKVYRDKVVAPVGEHYYNFIVKTRDDEGGVTAAPSAVDGTDPYWVAMSVYQTLVVDTLFGNNANIGGFMTTNQTMKSQRVVLRVHYQGEYSSSKEYSYVSGTDVQAVAHMVKYNDAYYVVKNFGDTITNQLPTTSVWRAATEEEISAVRMVNENLSDIYEKAYVDFYAFEVNGKKGIMTMRQSGGTSWEVNEDGKQIVGFKNGRRIELNPTNKEIDVFDDDGKVSSIFEGNKYDSAASLFGNSADDIRIQNRPSTWLGFGNGVTYGKGNTGVETYVDTSRTISNTFYTDGVTEIRVTGYVELHTEAIRPDSSSSYSLTRANVLEDEDEEQTNVPTTYASPPPPVVRPPVVPPPPLPQPSFTTDVLFRLNVLTYSDEACTNLIEKVVLYSAHCLSNPPIQDGYYYTGTTSDEDTFSGNINDSCLVVAGYHRIELVVSGEEDCNGSGEFYAKWGSAVSGKPDLAIDYVSDFYISRYFANGFCLGINAENYVSVFKESGGMRFTARNGNSIFDVGSDGIRYSTNGGSTWKSLT